MMQYLHSCPEVAEGVLAQRPKGFLAVRTQHFLLLLHVALHPQESTGGAGTLEGPDDTSSGQQHHQCHTVSSPHSH